MGGIEAHISGAVEGDPTSSCFEALELGGKGKASSMNDGFGVSSGTIMGHADCDGCDVSP